MSPFSSGRHPSGVVIQPSNPLNTCSAPPTAIGGTNPHDHARVWLRYPDASAPAADRVANVEATIAAISAMTPISRDECRSIASQAPSRSPAIARSRRASASHAPPAISAASEAASGDRAEIRKPPTVVRKPPLTAITTATTTSVAVMARRTFLSTRPSSPQALKPSGPQALRPLSPQAPPASESSSNKPSVRRRRAPSPASSRPCRRRATRCACRA